MSQRAKSSKTGRQYTEIKFDPDRGLIFNKLLNPSSHSRSRLSFVTSTHKRRKLTGVLSPPDLKKTDNQCPRQVSLVDYRFLDDNLPDEKLPFEYLAADWSRAFGRSQAKTPSGPVKLRTRIESSSTIPTSNQPENVKKMKIHVEFRKKQLEQKYNLKLET